MKSFIKFLKKINLKTIYFNLKYLPLKEAIKFPILISKNIILSKLNGNIEIKKNSTGMIKIGYDYGNIHIFDKKNTRGIWQVNGNVIFKGSARLGFGSKICVKKNGVLVLGENFMITAKSSIVVSKTIMFGSNCLISWDCLFMDSDFHKIYDNTSTYINEPKPIIVGSKVWIGCRNLILKGSIIPDNSVIGSSSIINKKLLEPNSIYAGNPIQLVKKEINWKA